MSEALINSAWQVELPVPNWKFVLVAMADDCLSSEGFYDADRQTLSELTGLDAQTVDNALIGLESRGLIQKVEGAAVDGFRILVGHSQ